MRLRRLVVACCAVLLLLAGCSTATSATDWAASVCTALDPWRAEIDRLTADAGKHITEAADPQEAKDQLVTLLGGAADATGAALDDVRRAGIPDVDDGDVIAQRFVDSLTAARDAYQSAHDAIAALPTDDEESFYEAVPPIMASLADEYAAIPQVGQLNSTELKAAFDSVPACR